MPSMTTKIKTYKDLLAEEQRLTLQLTLHKSLIKEDIAGIKERLNTFKRIAANIRGMFSRGDNGPLLNFGLNFGIDVLIRKILLGRAGWITKIVVPYVIKNYASHLVNETQRKAVTKNFGKFVSKILSKKRKDPFQTAPPL